MTTPSFFLHLFLAPLRGRLALLLLLAAPWARAQTPAGVRGAVQTPAGVPIEYATVTLHRAADSTVVKTEFSDDKGTFQFEAAPAGRYVVSAAQVGFERRWSRPFDAGRAPVELPVLQLAISAATQLQEVKVVGKLPLYEREADRTIVNVEGSTLAAGNTSLDVLRRAPGVTVDANDNLALRGKQGLLVLIDGKRQPMSGAELADYLRALPAEQLKNIELITNPPAKYDAQGGAGIIAINLKKDQRQGTNGTVNGSYGYSPYNKYAGGLSLNHRHQKVNLFGAYNYGDRTGVTDLVIHRNFYRASGENSQLMAQSDQDNHLPNNVRVQGWKAGADYALSKRTTVGVTGNSASNRAVVNGLNAAVVRSLAQGTAEAYYSTNYSNRYLTKTNANLNLRHVFDDSVGTRELTADLDYGYFTADRDNLLQTYTLQEVPLDQNSSVQTGDINLWSANVDYAQPLGPQARLEAGAKMSRVTTDNDLRFYTNQQFDLGRSNRFQYEETIRAGYLTLTRKRPGLTLTAGLRAEHTTTVGRQEREVEFQNFTRHYLNLFPSAALKRAFSERHETSFSLSRRIDRPTYSQLNPFRAITDRTTFASGNPALRPQTSYTADLTHTFRQKYSLGLSYSLTSQPIVSVFELETDSTVLSTVRNLSQQHYFGLTLTAPVQLAKWWTAYSNAVLYYNRFSGELGSTSLNRGGLTLQLTTNHSLTFGRGWSAELNGRYESRQVYGFLVQQPLGELAAGVQKALWDGKGTLKLSGADLLYTQTARVTSTYGNYVENYRQRRDSRQVTLSFSYRFGNSKVAPARRRADGAEDEKRRAG
ncbi:TonB-dependent receptor [Hymenobacter sp. BT523]|uniref:outer membrane beta-barrel protein n=1 Tax=Hymenobacter sp. BT523 TaxID=2795725 RepID=UPI0018EE091C|nr:outer membrane beta-barrel protein [Hymenobacter sp. BT523]MBJ6110324.1 TonB-dependent receptor [Hymenobacter sp. BT523]